MHMQRSTFQLPSSLDEALDRAVQLVATYAPLIIFDRQLRVPSSAEVRLFFDVCRHEFVEGDAIGRARADSSAFPGIPTDVLDTSARALHEQFNGDLVSYVQHVQDKASVHRFNPSRCRDVFSDDIEFETLLELSESGAFIPIPPDFVYQTSPEPLRKLYHKLGNTVPKAALKLYDEGKALLFRCDDVAPVTKLQQNNAHWCAKAFCDPGRFLFDCANIASGDSINSPWSFDWSQNKYGVLEHPSITGIVSEWVAFADAHHRPLSDLRIWKDDIKGAFGQFNFAPMSCHLLAVMVAQGILLIYIAGMFGYHACPLIFGVFTRSLRRVILTLILGCLAIYVDDLCGCSFVESAVRDQQIAQSVIVRAFGPGSVAVDKSCPPSLVGDIIGWHIDLVKETIRPNDRAIRKLMFAFFMVDLSAKAWPLRQCQMLASLAQRYSLALGVMKCFVAPLHHLSENVNVCTSSPFMLRNVSSAARFAVEMWRVATICLYVDAQSLALPLRALIRSKRYSRPDFFVRSDAGPLKAGFAIYDAAGNMLFYSSHAWPFARIDTVQNVKEFLAFLVSLLALLSWLPLASRSALVHWTGDNSAALSWVREHRCKSRFCQLAFTVYSVLCLHSQLTVVDVEHCPGFLMGGIDALSRDLPHSFDPSLARQSTALPVVNQILLTCDPVLVLEATLLSHHVALQRVLSIVSEFSSI